MRGDIAQTEFAACVRCDPVLALRLRLLPADMTAQPDLLRALLLAAPVATGAAQVAYSAHWRQSISVAHLAQALALRAAIADADAAWTAGLAHNLARYLEPGTAGITPLTRTHPSDYLAEIDPNGWLGDAARFHAEPLARGRAAHPLVRVVQLAYQLVARADAVDSVDVRAALAALQMGAGEAAQLLADTQMQTRQLALRFGLLDATASSQSAGFDRLARLYAGQAAQSAINSHFRSANRDALPFSLLQDTLQALFGIERICLFIPAADGHLRASAMLPTAPGLNALAIPLDDGHSALPRSLVRSAPQQFECGATDGALVDEQIARLLGVSRLLCQPLTLSDGQTGVLVAGDANPELGMSTLWRFTVAEYTAWLHPPSRWSFPPCRLPHLWRATPSPATVHAAPYTKSPIRSPSCATTSTCCLTSWARTRPCSAISA
ncbi:MAG: hypothetical protein A2580_15125 [Hydrogenophilales bacterium RIFOXYD1_FULL_62_11]|nr:MAG: hypothetical protein A2580_15125 [Hydrogenophilales bacterium RIFOXYD1_FULL_62_11]